MKTLKKSILLLTSFVMAMSAASCVNNELTEPEEGLAVKELATIDAQVASMEATVADLEALQTSAEGLEDELAGVVSSLESHIADLKAGAPLLEGTLATLAQQKKLAELIGTIEAGAEPTKSAALTKAVASIDKGAGLWLGKHFDSYYPAVKAEAAAKGCIASFDFKSQQILVEGVLSDVEAGLRKEFDANELAALAAGIGANAEQAEELAASLSSMTEEVEAAYTKAVETAVDDPENFDLPALTQLNSSVAEALAEADNTLAGLIARVEECETQVAELKGRVAALEGEIADLNELFGLIQSVTFMSEYSDEKAIAYYTLDTESREDGKKVRKPEGTIDLSYVIRPASAALALTSPELWDNEVKVFGYYAQTITKTAPETFDFDITNVTADESGNGIVTVTVSAASLNESFYFKETGAKLALSIATGKTDLTSKFVEIVPKDKSGKVYVEAIELSAKSIEIDNGSTADIDAFVTPSNVTEGGVIWTTSDASVLTVSNDGVVEGKSVGTAVVTATTNGTDEWGNTIEARCTVKVNPAIRLNGPDYVEEGGEVELRLESPNYINPDLVKWSLADENFASFVTVADGVVKGVKMYYDKSSKAYIPVTIVCKIDDSTQLELTHEIRVVAPQPAGLDVATVGTAGSHTVKVGEGFSLATAVKPDNVICGNFSSSDTQFRLRYTSNNASVANVNESGYISTSNPGTAYIDIEVHSNDTYSYWYPAGKSLKRQIQVNVEPYYVETITLPETFDLEVGLSSTLELGFTSDVDGKQPSYKDVRWTSSNETVATVDETTGEIKALAEGSTIITATTTNAMAVPSGSAQKSATCVLTVKEAGLKINVGDFYYSDGTWSETLDAGKTLVGIVCKIASPTAADSKIPSDFIHGYVVSVDETTDKLAKSTSVYRSHFLNYASSNGYPNKDEGALNWSNAESQNAQGYGNTLGYSAWTDEIANSDYSGYHGWTFFLVEGGLEKYRQEYSVDTSKNTDWYVPSQKEMTFLSDDNLTRVNNSLTCAGMPSISDALYWTSSIASSNYVVVNPLAKSVQSSLVTTECKVRFFLAF